MLWSCKEFYPPPQQKSAMATLYHHQPLLHHRKRPHPAPNTTTSTIHCSKLKNSDQYKEIKKAQVDYDAGTHRLHTSISGLRKSDLPKRNRLRVEGDRFQKDWSLSEVVDMVLKLHHWEDIESVLNRWAGRFARKNFPLLIRVKFFSPNVCFAAAPSLTVAIYSLH